MKRAIQTGFEGAHSLSSVDAKLEFLLAFIPVKWVTSPQPSADRPRKDGLWGHLCLDCVCAWAMPEWGHVSPIHVELMSPLHGRGRSWRHRQLPRSVMSG